MKPTTKAQRAALKRIYDRGPIYKGGSASQIAMNAGWVFVKVSDLPDDRKSWVSDPTIQYIWMHDNYPLMYRDAADIVDGERLSERLTYRQFRKTVAYGWDCLMVAWNGMWLGIEKDGYVHS